MSTQTAEALNAFDYDTPRTVVYESLRKVSPRGVTDKGDWDAPYARKEVLRNPCLVYDPIAKRERWARLLKGYATIWKDEQEVDGPLDPKLIGPLTIKPEFDNGLLFVDLPKDKLLAAFLNAHDDIEKDPLYRKSVKPVRYKLRDTGANSKQLIATMQLRQKAEAAAMDMTDADMVTHCKFLNIRMTDDINQKLDMETLRVHYVNFAGGNPKLFLESSVGSNMKLHNAINAMISKGDIDINSVKGSAVWGATKALILEFDTTVSDVPAAQLAKFAMGDGGADFKARVEKSVKETGKK